MSKIIQSSRGSNDDMGALVRILEIGFVFFDRNTSKITSISQLGLLEVAT